MSSKFLSNKTESGFGLHVLERPYLVSIFRSVATKEHAIKFTLLVLLSNYYSEGCVFFFKFETHCKSLTECVIPSLSPLPILNKQRVNLVPTTVG